MNGILKKTLRENRTALPKELSSLKEFHENALQYFDLASEIQTQKEHLRYFEQFESDDNELYNRLTILHLRDE